ncbi:sensor histidine kinase [Croceitalea sp. MTPC6]
MGWISAQSIQTERIDLLETFRNAEGAVEKFKFFFATPNRYTQNSAYDWLDDVKVYLNSAEKINDSSEIVLYKLIQAQLYNDLGDYDKSIAIAKELPKNKDSLGQRPLEILLTILDENYGKLQMFNEQIETREEKKTFGYTQGVAFYDIYEKMGLYRRAMEKYIMTVGTTIADNDHFGKAKYHNKIGNYLRLDKSEPTAITEFNKANAFLELFINDLTKQKSENELFEIELLKAEIEGNIGKSHVGLKQYIEALPYLKSSLDVFEEFDNDRYQAQIVDNTLNFANAHLQLSNYRTAKRNLDKIDSVVTVQQQLRLNRLLANYYDRTENYRTASIYYKNNERIIDSLKAKEQSILNQQLVAIVGTSDLENSRKLINEQKAANEKFRSEMQQASERTNLVIISLIFTLLGFAGLVYAYLKSIKNQRLIAQQKHIIEDSLKEKDSLLKEIHHRVKNNLQMVSSLLSLQTKNTRSKAAIEALEEGKSRVKAMALIHQKLYQNEDLSVIEMQGYIESLINSVQSVYKKGGHNISITIDAEGTELDIDRAIPFGLILNELVSNSFKYAFPESDENGKIYIHLRKNGEQGYFEYTDNGVGLPDDTDERANSSMGIRLMNRLVNQLQSKLNVDKSGEGVRFWFNFN